MVLLKQKEAMKRYDSGDIKFLASTDMKTNLSIHSIEESILRGEDPSKKYKGIFKMVKSLATGITLPGFGRYAYGKSITTYSGMSFINGIDTPLVDVWSDKLGSLNAEKIANLTKEETAIYKSDILIKEGFVIMSNGDLRYPEDYERISLRGLVVKGFYQADSTFIVDQETGTDSLQDEYLAPIKYVKDVYQVNPSQITQYAYKGTDKEVFPVYVFEPEAPSVKDSLGNKWEYAQVNKMIAISTGESGSLAGSSSISFHQFKISYTSWDEYHSKIKDKEIIEA